MYRAHRGKLMAGSAIIVMLAVGSARAEDQVADADATTAKNDVETVVVTATRREENIQRVPITVTAYSQQQMDDRGIKQIDDIARLTPDIHFTHTTGSAGNNVSDISIRGIESDVGAATTAIYIDDTPVQTRNVGYFSANPYPKIFDLQRVEVLLGPQGTLFGAGAEGGAIRFITPLPDLEKYSGYFRGEIADTIDGDPSYEAGAAVGGPIVQDVLGFRASAWTRTDGGYIDRVSPDTGALADTNTNYDISGAGKVAFAWAPIDGLMITPSVYYQNVYDHDRDQYWASLSHPSSDEFKQASRIGQPSRDQYALPALKIQYDLPEFSIISDTSLFYRKQAETLDYSNYLSNIFYGDPLTYLPGDVPSRALLSIHQHSLVQEVRAQSNDSAAFFNWTVGAFYSWSKQQEEADYYNGQGQIALFLGAPGITAGVLGEAEHLSVIDEQVAGYGDFDVNVTDQLKLTAGVRISNSKFNFTDVTAGPLVGGGGTNSGSQQETPITPKFSVSYQLDSQNLLYVTAAKGFRPGGAQAPIAASICAADLATLGETTSPTSYKSDSLWSYEAGAKDAFMGGALVLDSSVYVIKWDNIQQTIRLPHCGFAYTNNLGSATSVGGDLMARLKVTAAISVGANIGYHDTTYDTTISGGGGSILAEKGDKIGGPPFSASLWGMYSFALAEDTDAYYRLDYTFQNRAPSVDPRAFSYDPGIQSVASTSYISMRFGVTKAGWDVSAFVNNLSNTEEFISTSHDGTGASVYYNQSYRPTTAGITAAYRF